MTRIEERFEKEMRMGFKYLNRFMVMMWRLGLGSWVEVWPEKSGRIMVIIHTGRKTGLRRLTPVNYAIVDDDIYCMAGFGSISDWYLNMLARPEIEIWLPDSWHTATAEDVSDCPERVALIRQVVIGSGFAGPLFGVDQRKMTDAELDEATRSYRLIRIHRTGARTGPGGPGDLAWIWPPATFLLLTLLLLRRRPRA